MSARTQAYREKLRNGEYDLSWMHVNSEWGVKATPSKRGLTLDDINVGSYGVIPEDVSDSLSFAPRGADFDADDLPSMGYTRSTHAPKPGPKIWASSMKRRWPGSGARREISRGMPSRRCQRISNMPCASSAPFSPKWNSLPATCRGAAQRSQQRLS